PPRRLVRRRRRAASRRPARRWGRLCGRANRTVARRRLRRADAIADSRGMRRPFDLRGFVAVLYKELIHVTHDPTTLALALVLPLLQLLIFGYAINTRVEHIGTAYLDEDHGVVAVRVLDALRA